MKESLRMTRINELLQHEIATILEKIIDRESGCLVSVTEVNTTPDLRCAKVYISIFGSAESKKKYMKAVEKNRIYIQSLIASVIKIKYTPVLDFELDRRLEAGDKVLSIINDLDNDNPSNE
ncbi:MAG TPA: 30S ribosome-binding factor RbfA [Lentisphaeria bacterium]|nr:MAG: ribosome-binding factor A [Lentisphaerae bacterium GWF2_38_69]HBM17176.1 30S ribosome-binding factor RbfA [Lentisphaeria bacterium]